MYFSMHVVSKKDRKNKNAIKTSEYIEFAQLYPKKNDLSKNELINKYNKLVEE